MAVDLHPWRTVLLTGVLVGVLVFLIAVAILQGIEIYHGLSAAPRIMISPYSYDVNGSLIIQNFDPWSLRV